ncbi:MAG: energy-coupling factor transporter ATPase [Clostridiaceae bacterium]|jgi:energy-coupling factor transport system ATP-binding protein|nr:energy-coupling factor transporter ATPase [Clostridiaceae bacterium]
MSIIVENLSYIYMPDTPFEKVALKDINLKIEKGEFAGIIGHTGSGKSTLIQHFNGLLKPSSGRVLINGIDTTGKELRELRRDVGVVFQYPEHQLFEETVYKDIAFGLIKQNLTQEQVDAEIRKVIQTVGLKESILDKSPFELSGGQKRRVAIAGVLAMKPSILILDEPTAGLDPRGRDEIFGFITKIHETMGITVILVSHSMEDVARLVDRVIVMNDGQIELDGPVKEVFSDIQRLEGIGLSAPQISYMMQELKKILPDINDRVYTVSAARDDILRHLGAGGSRND